MEPTKASSESVTNKIKQMEEIRKRFDPTKPKDSELNELLKKVINNVLFEKEGNNILVKVNFY